jgi:transcriptional regulator with XRE-family HTH domain
MPESSEPTAWPDASGPHRFNPARIRAARRAAGLSRTALAVAIHRSEPTIGRLERGEVVPPADVIAHVANALGVHPGDLFDNVGEVDR